MAKYDLLFFDVDGTVVGPDHFTLYPRTRQALLAAREAGIKLAFATGRCRCILPASVLALDVDYAVTSNGMAIYDLKADKQLYDHPFPVELARTACRVVQENTDFYELFYRGQILVTARCRERIGHRPLPPWHQQYFDRGLFPVTADLETFLASGAPGLEKINLVECDPADIARMDAALRPLGVYELSSSIGKGYEVTPKGCTKAMGIQWLCDYLGIGMDRVIAFGDGGNDVDMLRAVGCGVAMGNASDAVKAAARHVTAAHDQDGIALYLEQFVL